ncbi:basic proline-rich protein-like [Sarcophilus harrisii]|uniref:basic proline-rich protein-like n=1 Tax=Sarcophilus harrisii TaxID=9305 RepID=UPI001301D41D|nr:basic proline-rich protein-like [Sarcophilus harrisii]
MAEAGPAAPPPPPRAPPPPARLTELGGQGHSRSDWPPGEGRARRAPPPPPGLPRLLRCAALPRTEPRARRSSAGARLGSRGQSGRCELGSRARAPRPAPAASHWPPGEPRPRPRRLPLAAPPPPPQPPPRSRGSLGWHHLWPSSPGTILSPTSAGPAGLTRAPPRAHYARGCRDFRGRRAGRAPAPALAPRPERRGPPESARAAAARKVSPEATSKQGRGSNAPRAADPALWLRLRPSSLPTDLRPRLPANEQLLPRLLAPPPRLAPLSSRPPRGILPLPLGNPPAPLGPAPGDKAEARGLARPHGSAAGAWEGPWENGSGGSAFCTPGGPRGSPLAGRPPGEIAPGRGPPGKVTLLGPQGGQPWPKGGHPGQAWGSGAPGSQPGRSPGGVGPQGGKSALAQGPGSHRRAFGRGQPGGPPGESALAQAPRGSAPRPQKSALAQAPPPRGKSPFGPVPNGEGQPGPGPRGVSRGPQVSPGPRAPGKSRPGGRGPQWALLGESAPGPRAPGVPGPGGPPGECLGGSPGKGGPGGSALARGPRAPGVSLGQGPGRSALGPPGESALARGGPPQKITWGPREVRLAQREGPGGPGSQPWPGPREVSPGGPRRIALAGAPGSALARAQEMPWPRAPRESALAGPQGSALAGGAPRRPREEPWPRPRGGALAGARRESPGQGPRRSPGPLGSQPWHGPRGKSALAGAPGRSARPRRPRKVARPRPRKGHPARCPAQGHPGKAPGGVSPGPAPEEGVARARGPPGRAPGRSAKAPGGVSPGTGSPREGLSPSPLWSLPPAPGEQGAQGARAGWGSLRCGERVGRVPRPGAPGEAAARAGGRLPGGLPCLLAGSSCSALLSAGPRVPPKAGGQAAPLGPGDPAVGLGLLSQPGGFSGGLARLGGGEAWGGGRSLDKGKEGPAPAHASVREGAAVEPGPEPSTGHSPSRFLALLCQPDHYISQAFIKPYCVLGTAQQTAMATYFRSGLLCTWMDTECDGERLQAELLSVPACCPQVPAEPRVVLGPQEPAWVMVAHGNEGRLDDNSTDSACFQVGELGNCGGPASLKGPGTWGKRRVLESIGLLCGDRSAAGVGFHTLEQGPEPSQPPFPQRTRSENGCRGLRRHRSGALLAAPAEVSHLDAGRLSQGSPSEGAASDPAERVREKPWSPPESGPQSVLLPRVKASPPARSAGGSVISVWAWFCSPTGEFS